MTNWIFYGLKNTCRVHEEFGHAHEKRFICSVEVEVADCILIVSGKEKSRVREAENAAAYLMIHELRNTNYIWFNLYSWLWWWFIFHCVRGKKSLEWEKLIMQLHIWCFMNWETLTIYDFYILDFLDEKHRSSWNVTILISLILKKMYSGTSLFDELMVYYMYARVKEF